MKNIPLYSDADPRSYPAPTVVRFPMSDGTVRFAIVGTQYGYLHTRGGDVRTWLSYSGARRAARAYVPF